MYYLGIAVLIMGGYLALNPTGAELGLMDAGLLTVWWLSFLYLSKKGYGPTWLVAFLSFLLFLCAETLNFGPLRFGDVATYAMVSLSFCFIAVVTYHTLQVRYHIAPALINIIWLALVTVPAALTVHKLNSGQAFTKEDLYAIFQTHPAEALNYIAGFVSPLWPVMLLGVAGLVTWILFLQQSVMRARIESALLSGMALLLIILSTLHVPALRLPQMLSTAAHAYAEELRLFHEMQEKRKKGKSPVEAEKSGTGETYIIVIGESLNKAHMGIYGYIRNTTPHLSALVKAGKVLMFNNAYANHTHTDQVMSLALTQANQLNHKNHFESPTLIGVLQQAGFKTYWLTNQTMQGVWDNMVAAIAREADEVIGINHSIGRQSNTQQHDGALIKKTRTILNEQVEGNRVIFINLMGNHYNYCDRYPVKEFSEFSGALTPGMFGVVAKSKKMKTLLNCYDNSVLYNDYVVSEILNVLRETSGVRGFIYLSDHSEDVLGNTGHAAGKFRFEMVQIPMLAWFSGEYKSKYDHKFQTFKRHGNTLFSNDFLYDTVIGITGIDTPAFSEKYDFSSMAYSLKSTNAYTLHHKKLYTGKDNRIWWQKTNTQYILESGYGNRVFPHRVNSRAKLHDIWSNGWRSFEVDAFFRSSSGEFQVGHHRGRMGDSLEAMLLSIDHTQISRIWLDLKNLETANYVAALQRLAYLDQKFGLRNRLLVESATTDIVFKNLAVAGWQTSYYLPTTMLIGLTRENDTVALSQSAAAIARQAKAQNLAGISFDRKLYTFVKRYLEPHIDKAIVYHAWFGPALYDHTLQSTLTADPLFQDSRVKTLLSVYASKFDL